MGKVFGEALANKKEESHLCSDKQYPQSQSLVTGCRVQQAQTESPSPAAAHHHEQPASEQHFDTCTRFFCLAFLLQIHVIYVYIVSGIKMQKWSEMCVNTKSFFRHFPSGHVSSTPACSIALRSTKKEEEETGTETFFCYIVFTLVLLTSAALCDSSNQLICHQQPELR